MRQAELALIVIAIMRAEVESQMGVATSHVPGGGTESGSQPNREQDHGKIGEEHAACLMENIESLREALNARVRTASTGETSDNSEEEQEAEWLALQQKADAWRGRLAVIHCKLLT